MSEMETIPLPGLKRIWRVRVADNIDTPQFQTHILLRAESALDAIGKAIKSATFKKFQDPHPSAQVVEVTFGGVIE